MKKEKSKRGKVELGEISREEYILSI